MAGTDSNSKSTPHTSDNTTRATESTNPSSVGPSRASSVGLEAQKQKGNHRVKFSGDGEAQTSPPRWPLPSILLSPTELPNTYGSGVSDLTEDDATDTDSDIEVKNELASRKRQVLAVLSAHERAQRLATSLSRYSAPASRRNSAEFESLSELASPTVSRTPSPSREPYLKELTGFSSGPRQLQSPSYASIGDEDEIGEEDGNQATQGPNGVRRHNEETTAEAERLVRAMTGGIELHRVHALSDGLQSGHMIPIGDEDLDSFISRPIEFKIGILASLLSLRGTRQSMTRSVPTSPRHSRFIQNGKAEDNSSTTATLLGTPGSSPTSSGRNTPYRPKWYDNKKHTMSASSLSSLLAASNMMATPGSAPNNRLHSRPVMHGRTHSGGLTSTLQKVQKVREAEHRITVHVAEVMSRQRYLLKLCKALMLYGAPTHRLEQYLTMSAKVLQIKGQFLYLPGCMLISFDDTTTHTAEVRFVRTDQFVDLGKMMDIHNVYKEVVHDMVGVEEAMERIDVIDRTEPKFNVWILVLMYGLCSAFVGPFAFGARPIDMPICFLLGCVVGFMQLIVPQYMPLFANVFDVAASVITSFLARAFGSIRSSGTEVFCFSAIAQSAIALILPGYIILCGALELQSKSIVSGSVRMVYAIIYSLFLGFGISIGSAMYGLVDPVATSSYTCPATGWIWDTNEFLSRFPWVPLFTFCLVIINQAKWRQVPVMLFIAFAGYQVNYWSARKFANNVQVANALGAFVIGALGNLYSRLRHGVAAAAILPAIFVQVPSGIAASGSFVNGVDAANQIVGNSSGASVIANGTAGFSDAATGNPSYNISSTVYNLGYGMVMVAIGISTGLFLSTMLIYPFYRSKRSALFSF